MGLTTERKVFLGLMVVAGASLVIDQAILSPSSASAAPLGDVPLQTSGSESLISSITSPITKSVTDVLNERLSSAQINSNITPEQSQELQQMFAPLLNKQITPPAEQPNTQEAAPEPPKVITTEPIHTIPTNLPNLTAVMPSRSGNSAAILDATLYRVGDTTPAGYTLLKVEKRQVLVRYQDRQYWLVIPAFEE
ncbi:MAG: hypothetical protein JJ974_06035 [Phycisphaerales bacterium]|nr:hypothetical protein [Phycisphaerales bacterium]